MRDTITDSCGWSHWTSGCELHGSEHEFVQYHLEPLTIHHIQPHFDFLARSPIDKGGETLNCRISKFFSIGITARSGLLRRWDCVTASWVRPISVRLSLGRMCYYWHENSDSNMTVSSSDKVTGQHTVWSPRPLPRLYTIFTVIKTSIPLAIDAVHLSSGFDHNFSHNSTISLGSSVPSWDGLESGAKGIGWGIDVYAC